MFVRKFSIDQGNSDLYASSLVPWNDPKKNSSDQKPSKLKIFKFLSQISTKQFLWIAKIEARYKLRDLYFKIGDLSLSAHLRNPQTVFTNDWKFFGP